MTRRTLQQHVNPAELARKRARLEGVLAPAELARLCEVTLGIVADIEIELEFSRRRPGGTAVQGQVRTVISQVCQTCLDPVEISLSTTVDLLLLGSDEEIQVQPVHQDTLFYEVGAISIADLIEDDLLLALPMVPRHSEDCLGKLDYEAPRALEPVRKRPFQDLGDLVRQLQSPS